MFEAKESWSDFDLILFLFLRFDLFQMQHLGSLWWTAGSSKPILCFFILIKHLISKVIWLHHSVVVWWFLVPSLDQLYHKTNWPWETKALCSLQKGKWWQCICSSPSLNYPVLGVSYKFKSKKYVILILFMWFFFYSFRKLFVWYISCLWLLLI